MANRNLSIVSMFSGCGGMDLGFRGGFEFLGRKFARQPFDIIWANDLNPYACKTYEHNIGAHIHTGDVWSLMDTLPETADLLIGGFPCQDISVNGKMRGVFGERSGLYSAMVEGIRRVQPKAFIAENVKALLFKNNKPSLEKVLNDFGSLGYQVTIKLYKAVNYGVPQSRERVFIVGVPKGKPDFIHPAPVLDEANWVTAEQAIDDLASVKEDATINHIWSRANKSPDQGSRRLVAERPGYTIRAECHGNIQFHYELDRRISMREAARFQSFPDDFIFQSRLRETERQVGNAVPPVLAWHIAKAMKQYLDASGSIKNGPDEEAA